MNWVKVFEDPSELKRELKIYQSNTGGFFPQYVSHDERSITMSNCGSAIGDHTRIEQDLADPVAFIRWLKDLESFLESQQIAHHDINPANILWDGNYYTLVDFVNATVGESSFVPPWRVNEAYSPDDHEAINMLCLECISKLIGRLATDGYKDGSSAIPGMLYHPLPFPEFRNYTAHKNEVVKETNNSIDIINKHFGGIEGKTIVEIGSADGYTAFKLAEAGAKKIIAYEGDKLAYDVAEAVRLYKGGIWKERVRFINSYVDDTTRFPTITDVFIFMNTHMWVHKQIGDERTRQVMRNIRDIAPVIFQTAGTESGGMYTIDSLGSAQDVIDYFKECGFEWCDWKGYAQGHGGKRHLIVAGGKQEMNKPEVSIIVPTFNHFEDCLKPCLESIKETTDLDKVEIIVVANGCTDGTRDYMQAQDEHFKLVWFDEPLGYTKATNEGLKVAKGEYIVFLNNDARLLPQEKNTWLNLMIDPMKKDPSIGVTGPLRDHSPIEGYDFMVFFCATTRREVIDKVGLLDEWFSPGSGEDIDFCIKAANRGYKLLQVPEDRKLGFYTTADNKRVAQAIFPIFHEGEATMDELPNWKEIFASNFKKLQQRYAQAEKAALHNNYERAVIGKDDIVPPREKTRYEWAAQHLRGTRVLELGCSSGYGQRFFPSDIDYTGIDYDEAILKYAKKHFPDGKYVHLDLEKEEIEGEWDTIIAFEVLEHLDNAFDLAQKLKKKCKRLLCTVPYREPPGLWGPHHKHHNLTENEFPGFSYQFINRDGILGASPFQDVINLMLMYWDYDEPSVEVVIPTRNRYDSLAITLYGLMKQTYKNWTLHIIDDTQEDLRANTLEELHKKHPELALILNIIGGSRWRLTFGKQKGPHFSHQLSLDMTKADYIWRIDDDEVAEPRCLEKLVKAVKQHGAVAVGPRVLTYPRPPLNEAHKDDYGKIGWTNLNVQNQQGWPNDDDYLEVEHLHSSFLYKVKAAKAIDGFCLNYSRVGHREETDFTYRLFKDGGKLIALRDVSIDHLQRPDGGIRSHSAGKDLWDADDKWFWERVKNLNPNTAFFPIFAGIGDHLAAIPTIRELEKRGKKVLVGTSCDVLDDMFERCDLAAAMQANEPRHKPYAYDNKMHLVQEWGRLWGVDIDMDFDYRYEVSPEIMEATRQFKDSVLIFPFSRHPYKRWVDDRWREVIEFIKGRGLQVIQLGSHEDPGLADTKMSPNLRYAMGMLANCRTFVGVDTWGGHAGHFLDKPGVVMWGETSPLYFGYESNINIDSSDHHPVLQWLINENLTNEKMLKIETSQVIEALKKLT